MDGNQLFRQVDGCLLGITRMGFGLLMFIDCFVERGLHYADQKWTDDGCQFPLFNWLKPLSSEWMTILQFVQGLGAFFIFIGFRVRRTGWLFIIPYWYMFLLDKTHWNNHSYLFGLMGILFTIIESDQSASSVPGTPSDGPDTPASGPSPSDFQQIPGPSSSPIEIEEINWETRGTDSTNQMAYFRPIKGQNQFFKDRSQVNISPVASPFMLRTPQTPDTTKETQKSYQKSYTAQLRIVCQKF